MKILFSLLGDETKASSRVRGFWIAEELEKLGMHCSLRWKSDKVSLTKFAWEVLSFDVIVFQKTFSRYHKWLMYWAKMWGKKVYMDIDDAPSLINSPVTLANFSAMVKRADGVWCGSPKLVDYVDKIEKGKSKLIPTTVKLKNYPYVPREHKAGKLCLGWIGNGRYYKDDLIKILKPALTEVARQNPLRFKIVGVMGEQVLYEAFSNIPDLEVDFIDQIQWNNPQKVSEALQDIDIGLYPLLPKKEFNHYKCGFKALEYMAIGIPVVSSKVAANQHIIEHGVDGYLAESIDWTKHIIRLISDQGLRIRMGKYGRKKVEDKYNTSVASNLILTILQ